MNLKELDLFHLSKLTSQQVDHVTCLECCKYYIAPETATCGHTLCHTCWRGRRTCPSCAAPLEKKALKLNLQIQNLTEHIHALGEAFEKLFSTKLDEFVLDGTNNEIQYDTDPSKNVKDWLASSQNQFSAPVLNSEPFTQETQPVELSTSKIQIHSNSKKSKSPQKIIYVPPPQDDWDKIEQMVDSEEIGLNNKENITNQTNKQAYLIGDEYTTENPRRSSRKREYSEPTSKNQETNSKNSSSETEKKSSKAKQNWNNVKRMRKEFSKLNKKNRSKLNVSIEMCKKTQNTNKANNDSEQIKQLLNKDSQPATYVIEDNTPDVNINNIEISRPNDEIVVYNNKENETVTVPPAACLEEPKNDITIANNTHASVPELKDTTNIQGEIQSKNIATDTCVPDVNKPVNTKIPSLNKTELCSNCSGNRNNLDDIEITFKIGNTLTNITIKRKNNDVQLRVKADREVQTTLGANCLASQKSSTMTEQKSSPQEVQINIANNNMIAATQIEDMNVKVNGNCGTILNKSISTKKNTASADTATAQFEITESVEKELSNVMECVETIDKEKHQDCETNLSKMGSETHNKNRNDDENCDDYINDLDIFDNESVQEQHVQLLNKSKQAPSEILVPTVKTKSQRHPDKRDREINDEEEVPNAKKVKTFPENVKNVVNTANNNSASQPCPKDSESMNYDDVMGQVFASIDADIEKSQKSSNKKEKNPTGSINKLSTKSPFTEKIFQSQVKQAMYTQKIDTSTKDVNEKYSENIFSIVEKEDEINDITKRGNDYGGSTQRHIDNLLTPGMCQDLISTEGNIEPINKELCTPLQDHDDSDKSVVEETPQKNVSFPKPKTISDVNVSHLQRANSNASRVASSSQLVKSIINVSDTMVDTTKSKDQTVIDAVAKKALETPLTINKFVDHIKHKSTPVARKSLNFDKENVDDDVDPEQTLCPSSVVAKTTQEKEFMTKAFEPTPQSPVKKSLLNRSTKGTDLKYCIAGSCLSAVEITNLKYLCRKYNWKYVDKYTKELTHLVVGVDEENRSQRSVKYMCALAASKWIVSYEWVDACLNTDLVVGESLYEALDGTGEPGPQRSRLAKTKLFEGITFYCMPPFSVLDVDTLKAMLEAAGGRVVGEARLVRAASAPALLLAEPEHTQEDRFVYLALELNIVPVNYEWVLNCLGSYSLSSIHELLMCPTALLPPCTAQWPEVLVARDTE